MPLNKAQKKFIRKKVKSFKNKEDALRFYSRKSLVCEYAHKIAKKFFKKKKGEEN